MQELKDTDYKACIAFANRCLKNIQADESFLNRVIYSFKRVFYVNGKVPKYDVRILGQNALKIKMKELALVKKGLCIVRCTHYNASLMATGADYEHLLTN